MKTLQRAGLALFIIGFGVFLSAFFLEHYQLSTAIIEEQIADEERRTLFAEHGAELIQSPTGLNFEFIAALDATFAAVNAAQAERYGIGDEAIRALVQESKTGEGYTFQLSALDKVFDASTEKGAYRIQKFKDHGSWLDGQSKSEADLRSNLQNVAENVRKYAILPDKGFPDYQIKSMRFSLTKAASQGIISSNPWLMLGLSYLLAIIGALMYLLPKKDQGTPGIKNNGIFHSALKNRGWLGITVGVFLVVFYIFLYFFPAYMTGWVLMVDPISKLLSGNGAGEFFLYGFLYTLAVAVMGVRMIIKYRHSKYQIVRTISVMFFQTCFAFILPEILVKLNQPYFDFKNIWPLDYDFFFETELNKLIAGGNVGIFMLVWGIALTVIGVPLFVHFFGKRWYCSWVCGCGGLAETLGDPYRQLSDKSMPAWQIERFIIHGVLVFAIVMTALVLYTFFSEDSLYMAANRWYILAAVALIAGALVFLHRKYYQEIPGRKVYTIAAVFVGAVAIYMVSGQLSSQSSSYEFSSFQVRSAYGFFIGAIFSGVVGTGFYPFMGNRVWCRFGCPLAAYLGLVQRFGSRFRITTNGDQCISCGNCSTYCEMGIDVRAYAQRNQNIVRSSCVGCGVCSAVCPRGVLNLENGPMKGRLSDENPIMISNNGVKVS